VFKEVQGVLELFMAGNVCCIMGRAVSQAIGSANLKLSPDFVACILP